MEFIKIGNIANIHGIKGELSIYPYTDDVNNFCKYKTIYIGEKKESFNINRARPHKNMILVLLDKISNPEDALKLKTMDIYIDKNDLKKLDDDSYYVEDLIGIEVIDNISKECLGTLKDVINNPANDVYEVVLNDEIYYIPAIHQVVKRVDILNRKMYVELMEGLK